MRSFPKSDKLEHVCYDIRGPVHKEALRLEEEGNKILKLQFADVCCNAFWQDIYRTKLRSF